jgi:hypothetical protein
LAAILTAKTLRQTNHFQRAVLKRGAAVIAAIAWLDGLQVRSQCRTNPLDVPQYSCRLKSMSWLTNHHFISRSTANDFFSMSINGSPVSFSVVPEPGSIELLLIGALTIGVGVNPTDRSPPHGRQAEGFYLC